MRVVAPVSVPAEPAADDELMTALAATPWSVRRARGPGRRPALELYEAGRLADIIVATSVAQQLVRGARRSARDGQVFGLAWGCLPADGLAVSVAFARGWPHRATVRAEVVEAAGLAWFAIAAGRFAVVSAVHQGRCYQLSLQARPLW
jgi:hypothetical protein